MSPFWQIVRRDIVLAAADDGHGDLTPVATVARDMAGATGTTRSPYSAFSASSCASLTLGDSTRGTSRYAESGSRPKM